LAGGAEAFLFDVKYGNGALMKTETEARELAQGLVEGAAANGRRAVALLTDMNQPLGYAIGNSLEIAEAVQTLTPGASGRFSVNARFRQLCLTLASEGIELAGIASGEAARLLAQEVLASGAALSVFRRLVKVQGGDVSLIDRGEPLPKAPVIRSVAAPQGGYLARMDTAEIGNIVVALGGGRAQKDDAINPTVGLIMKTHIGAKVRTGEPLVEIHAQAEADATQAAERILDALHFSVQPVAAPPLVIDRVSAP
jgi:pyrimidine-nucleoside phosphorylase